MLIISKSEFFSANFIFQWSLFYVIICSYCMSIVKMSFESDTLKSASTVGCCSVSGCELLCNSLDLCSLLLQTPPQQLLGSPLHLLSAQWVGWVSCRGMCWFLYSLISYARGSVRFKLSWFCSFALKRPTIDNDMAVPYSTLRSNTLKYLFPWDPHCLILNCKSFLGSET